MPKSNNSGRQHAGRFEPSLRQFAHELNSMLDGSIRYVALVQQMLESTADAASLEQAAGRLAVAQQGLQSMATLLQRTLRGDVSLGDDQEHLGQQVRRIIAVCAPMAEQAGVSIDLHMAESVLELPSGPLAPIILNGLRNAIEACAASEARCRQVEVSIGPNGSDRLEVIVADTGPGLAASKPGGYGVGLDLCRQLAENAGGSLELINVPFGGGAVLRVVIPIRRLQRA